MDEDTIRAIKRRHSPRLMQQPGVSGVGVEKDSSSGEFYIAVHVDAGDTAVEASVPKDLEGAPVRVVRSGPFRPLGAKR